MVIDTIERLRAALKLKGVTKRDLAAKAGIHRMSLHGCERDTWNPKVSTLRAIEPHLPEIGE